ncbi:MAG: hypothetical protein R2789_19520 [Microthrixaceae bacterium]
MGSVRARVLHGERYSTASSAAQIHRPHDLSGEVEHLSHRDDRLRWVDAGMLTERPAQVERRPSAAGMPVPSPAPEPAEVSEQM